MFQIICRDIDTQIENEQRAHHRKNVRQLLYRFNI